MSAQSECEATDTADDSIQDKITLIVTGIHRSKLDSSIQLYDVQKNNKWASRI